MIFMRGTYAMSFILSGMLIAEGQNLLALFCICLGVFLEKTAWGIFGKG